MQVLYEHSEKREESRMRFEAKLHGATFADEEEIEVKDPVTDSKFETQGPLFKDPEVYAQMTEEERERETQRLMAFTKQWANTKPLGGKQPIIGG